jgi:uncharacterized protein YndB with AHSA1/START domain
MKEDDMADSFNATVNIDIAAPAAKVWDGITNPEIIAQYMMGAHVATDWKVGHPITWAGEFNGQAFRDKGEVLVFDPPKRLSVTHWSPLSNVEDKPENYHVVTYDLSETGGVTTLKLTQSNNSSQEAADDMARDGWTPMLQTLKRVLEQ